MIKFNIPIKVDNFQVNFEKLSGDGVFTKKCHEWFQNNFLSPKVLLTTSCTHALEMSAILLNIQPGDEIIAPSFTFVSTVNAFVLRGAKIVFVDIRPDTMNLDENLIEAAITNKTKAIVVVHYAGVSCEMDLISEIAGKYNLSVIEDAAQAMMATYKGKFLGTLGDFGTFSFHETKNYTMGEGGALLIGNKIYFDRAEIIREKGTDRTKFFRGQVDKYSWIDIGSSYLPSDINAAYLYPQLLDSGSINENRLYSWNLYFKELSSFELKGKILLPFIPDYCKHNAHMFYIKCKDLNERSDLISFLKDNQIQAVYHYIPLHSSSAGLTYGVFNGQDKYTTIESERLLRLPLYFGITSNEVLTVCKKIKEFYNSR